MNSETVTEQTVIPSLKKSRRREFIFVAVLLVLALLLRLNFRQGRVSGASMEPTYSDGDTVLVWKTVPRATLKPRDVVIIHDRNGDELVKRIAFIRPVWIGHSPTGAYVHPNGGRLVPYSVLFDDYFQKVAMGKKPKPAPDCTLYVLGDNLPISDDSRDFGPVSPAQILGKVVP